MKINELNLQQNTRQITVNDFKRPATLGNTPKEVNKALDNAFKPIKSLLQHSLSGLFSAGYNSFVGYGVLLQLCQNPLIRAAVESKASDMTNRWGEFTIEGDNNSEKLAERCETLNKQMKKYGIQKLFRKGACGAGYFGGTYLFIDILGDEQEDWINPLILSKETIPIGTLRGFKIIDPYLVTPTHYNSINPMADNYYQPQIFYVQGIPVHTSRLLYFGEGEPLPTMLRPAYNFTNISLAQKMLDAVSHYTSCRENAQALLERCALTVFKTDMGAVLTGGADIELQNRVKYFIQNRSNFGVATIDKEQEELVTQTTPLGGITEITQRAMEFVAAMADEPVTRMWGLSPAGFSTGDSDIRNHYDKIEAKQEMMFRKNIEIVNQLLQYNYFGDYDREIVFTFASLTEENESVKIANNIQKAQYDATLLQNGIIQQEDVRKRLLDDPDSGYNSLEKLEDMPPAMQPFIDEPDGELPPDGIPQAYGAYTQELTPQYNEGTVTDAKPKYEKEPDDWITIKGNAIPLDKDGKPMNKVGKKIMSKAAPTKTSSLPTSKPSKVSNNYVSVTIDDVKKGNVPQWVKDSGLKISTAPNLVDISISDDGTSYYLYHAYAVKPDGTRQDRSVRSPWAVAEANNKKFAVVDEIFAHQKEFEDAIKTVQKVAPDIGDMISLMYNTGIRVDSQNKTGSNEKAFGATTLQGKHIVENSDGSVSLVFRGKSHSDHNHIVTDKQLAKKLLKRKAEAGDDGNIFGKVKAEQSINALNTIFEKLGMKGRCKNHSLRHFNANRWTLDYGKENSYPTTSKEQKNWLANLKKYVGDRLGDTPSTAWESYINPKYVEMAKGV